MAKTTLDEMAEYAESHDFAGEMEREGVWETDVVEDPMVTTSLRMPKSLLDWVRAQAACEYVRPSVWIRQQLEHQRDGAAVDLVTRVSRLEHAIFHKTAP